MAFSPEEVAESLELDDQRMTYLVARAVRDYRVARRRALNAASEIREYAQKAEENLSRTASRSYTTGVIVQLDEMIERATGHLLGNVAKMEDATQHLLALTHVLSLTHDQCDSLFRVEGEA